VKLRFLFVRAAAGTLAVGNAAPVNLPFAVQAQVAEAAFADAPAHAAMRVASVAPRGDVAVDAGDLRRDARLKIGARGELPCDSGEWANNSLFGPRAQVLAALGIAPKGSQSTGGESALADSLSDKPTGDAESSAFGSIFGNAPVSGGPGDFLGLGGGGSGNGGPVIGGGGTIGSGGTTTGGGPVVGGGTSPGGPTGGIGTTGGTGTTGGSTGGGTEGGGTITNPTDPVTGGGTTPPDTGGNSGGTTGGVTTPPIDPTQPINPGEGGGHGGGGSTVQQPDPPVVTGAVPEPASWVTMLFGFGLIGAMLRRRRLIAA
jgi:hypothetical protein